MVKSKGAKSRSYLEEEIEQRRSQLKYRSFLREKTERNVKKIEHIMPWR